MTDDEIEQGAELAFKAALWVTFVRKPDLEIGALRNILRELFGPEVDMKLLQNFGGSRATMTTEGSPP